MVRRREGLLRPVTARFIVTMRSRSCPPWSGCGLAMRQLPARSREMACLAVGVFLQVILILVVGLPERTGGLDLGDDLAGPQAGRIDIGDRVLGDPLLLITGVEDRGTVLGADAVHLAVDRRRIVDLKEELEDVAEEVRSGSKTISTASAWVPGLASLGLGMSPPVQPARVAITPRC